jgi:DNA-directed RNA polymerase III subunit RPC1
LEDLSLQYDSTVRNSENTVVQFTYGDDGLHPDKMEDNDRPVDFHRLRLHVSQIAPGPSERTLSSDELTTRVEYELRKDRFTSLLPVGRVFLQEIQDYFASLSQEQTDLITDADNDSNVDFRT